MTGSGDRAPCRVRTGIGFLAESLALMMAGVVLPLRAPIAGPVRSKFAAQAIKRARWVL